MSGNGLYVGGQRQGHEQWLRQYTMDTPSDFLKLQMDYGLILFSADIQISRIYADNKKFG